MITKKRKSDAMEFLEKITGGPLNFGELLSSVRLGEEETQTEFARKLRISVAHLSDLENGRKTVSPERAARFAKILSYSEKQFVRLSLQDSLNRQGLDRFLVDLKAA